MNALQLLSGSDIRGHADRDLNNTVLDHLMRVFSQHLKNQTVHSTVVIGKDSRVSGPRIEKCLIDSLCRNGIKVIQLKTTDPWRNVSTTPMVFQAVNYYHATAGIMITASHLPQEWNGLKFFNSTTSYSKDQIKDLLIKSQAITGIDFSEDAVALTSMPAELETVEFLPVYAETIARMIRQGIKSDGVVSAPLSGLRILTDAGNGASGFFADYVLKSLGATIEGSLYLEPDGLFPHHIPNPEEPGSIRDLSESVIKHKADLGIIFDTDGDRSSVVLPDGRPVTHNRILALVAAMTLAEHPGSYLVTDSVTSDRLTAFIIAHGGIHRRFKRGYDTIRQEMKRLNDSGRECWVGGETSGHIMFRENNYADDGSYTVAKILIYMARLRNEGRNLESVLSDLTEPAESQSWRIPLHCQDFQSAGQRCIDHLIHYAQQNGSDYDITEGIRMNFHTHHSQGWILIRLSLHEPLLVVNAESDTLGGMAPMLDILQKQLSGFRFLSLDFSRGEG